MNFEKFVSEFEERISLERLYDIKRIDGDQIIGIPTGENIELNQHTRGYCLNRPSNTSYEIFLFKKTLGKHILWVFKRSGEYIGNRKFSDLKEAMKWMNDTYIRDAEMKLNEKNSQVSLD